MKKTLILSFLLFFTTLSTSFATHLVGGTMSYKFVERVSNANRYAFRMTIYRDCSASSSSIKAPFDEIVSIGFYDGTKRIVSIQNVPLVGIKATGLCINGYCVETGTYEWTKDLPILTTNYTIIYQRCCRAETFTNILNPSATGMTVALVLTPAAQTLSNNSPVFNSTLPLALCVNQNLTLDFSAIDADNDTLKYEFYNVFSGGAQIGGNGCNNTNPSPPCLDGMLPAAYRNTTSFDKPLGAGIVINEKSGKLSGTTDELGVFAFGIKVSEYRNNVLLSQSYLDYSIYALPCPNQNSICSTPSSLNNIMLLPVKISPNPTQGFIQIETELNSTYSVDIANTLGQVLKRKNLQGKSTSLDISDLPNGIYMVAVKTDGAFGIIKFTKN